LRQAVSSLGLSSSFCSSVHSGFQLPSGYSRSISVLCVGWLLNLPPADSGQCKSARPLFTLNKLLQIGALPGSCAMCTCGCSTCLMQTTAPAALHAASWHDLSVERALRSVHALPVVHWSSVVAQPATCRQPHLHRSWLRTAAAYRFGLAQRDRVELVVSWCALFECLKAAAQPAVCRQRSSQHSSLGVVKLIGLVLRELVAAFVCLLLSRCQLATGEGGCPTCRTQTAVLSAKQA
jgi:hypothetical protein